MLSKKLSIRPFIGAKDFNLSRSFYRSLGYEETVIETKLSLFNSDKISFYLQDAYVKDWIDNTMVFIEVDNVNSYWKFLLSLKLTDAYPNARISPIKKYDWGSECFVHDPSGILWHFGEFTP